MTCIKYSSQGHGKTDRSKTHGQKITCSSSWSAVGLLKDIIAREFDISWSFPFSTELYFIGQYFFYSGNQAYIFYLLEFLWLFETNSGICFSYLISFNSVKFFFHYFIKKYFFQSVSNSMAKSYLHLFSQIKTFLQSNLLTIEQISLTFTQYLFIFLSG